MKNLIVLASLLLCGCATADDITKEEREYRQAVDLANWKLCEEIYLAYGKPTFHKGHTHRIKNISSNHYVRQDLMSNNCKRLLKSGGLWNEY